jgi:hypothetical protein
MRVFGAPVDAAVLERGVAGVYGRTAVGHRQSWVPRCPWRRAEALDFRRRVSRKLAELARDTQCRDERTFHR